MPIDRPETPLRAAMVASSAKCGAAWSVDRRNAHQAVHAQAVFAAAAGDEGVGLLRQDAGFLRLGAGVDLQVEPGAPPGLLRRVGEGARDPRAVHRLDRIEGRQGVGGLVRLQRADQVEIEAGVALAQLRPLALRLLYAVLPEDSLARVECRDDVLGGEGLGDADQGHRCGVAPAIAGCACQALAHVGPAAPRRRSTRRSRQVRGTPVAFGTPIGAARPGATGPPICGGPPLAGRFRTASSRNPSRGRSAPRRSSGSGCATAPRNPACPCP